MQDTKRIGKAMGVMCIQLLEFPAPLRTTWLQGQTRDPQGRGLLVPVLGLP